ncbi:MAG: tRNA pseudouridine(55) synthase TruB [Lachnospiraceae bacterium]|nr:tRNA pseudouridine(55) synthase TruB [Lachnospiraceae bacterium]
MNGIINIYKEAGFTSFDVVAKMRGILKTRKIGHTGTLDPMATGVLPVCVGAATKAVSFLTDHDKEYVAELLLGVTTDTLDTTGKVLETRPVNCDEAKVRGAVMSFQGVSEQIPPMYSAIKVDGKRLYELARDGREIERKPRIIEIPEMEILSMELPVVRFRVVCSRGTYIRSLCQDIGEKLGCGGCMQSLERIRVGQFGKDTAITLQELERHRDQGTLSQVLLGVDQVFADLPAMTVRQEFLKAADSGNKLKPEMLAEPENFKDEERVRLYRCDGRFYGIYVFRKKERVLKPAAFFLRDD